MGHHLRRRLLASSGHGPYAAQAKVVAAALATTVAPTRRRGRSSRPRQSCTRPRARPKTRYPVGQGARAILLLRRLLPDRAFDAVLWNIYKRFPA